MRAQWTVYVTITIVVLAAIQFTMLVKPPTKVSQIVLNTDVHQFQRSESNAQFQHEPSQAMEFSSVPENAFVTEPLDTPVELAATRKVPEAILSSTHHPQNLLNTTLAISEPRL